MDSDGPRPKVVFNDPPPSPRLAGRQYCLTRYRCQNATTPPACNLTGTARMERVNTASSMPPLAQGVAAGDLRDTFGDGRDGSQRGHEAVDSLAPRGTPVLANGLIVKSFLSKPGGITICQFDTTGQLACDYAHLARHADGLAEVRTVRRGSVIGYVGSTGNASPDAPHLHFAIFRLGPEKQWRKGEPINPSGYLGGKPP